MEAGDFVVIPVILAAGVEIEPLVFAGWGSEEIVSWKDRLFLILHLDDEAVGSTTGVGSARAFVFVLIDVQRAAVSKLLKLSSGASEQLNSFGGSSLARV